MNHAQRLVTGVFLVVLLLDVVTLMIVTLKVDSPDLERETQAVYGRMFRHTLIGLVVVLAVQNIGLCF